MSLYQVMMSPENVPCSDVRSRNETNEIELRVIRYAKSNRVDDRIRHRLPRRLYNVLRRNPGISPLDAPRKVPHIATHTSVLNILLMTSVLGLALALGIGFFKYLP